MELSELREQINQLDDTLSDAFLQRMEVALEIAQYKKEHKLPVYVPERERAVVNRLVEKCPDEMKLPMKTLYNTVFDLSRSYQRRHMYQNTALTDSVKKALEETPAIFPQQAVVACQGMEGAYSQQACDRLFALPSIFYFKRFEGVFQAIDSGLCRYGILPIENSSYGSVSEVYDLMRKYHFHIVQSTRIKVDHRLLVKPGVRLSDIREIVSHEQAIGQCSEFLKKHENITVTNCVNTAVAAKTVSESDRNDMAAIASANCAPLYGLQPLDVRVTDSESNFTRFICIAREMEIYPGADRMSLMMALPHQPGSLYRLMSRFAALGLNLTKLESRPIVGSDFEFMFYFDLAVNAQSDEAMQLLHALESDGISFTYLGSYREV